MILNKLHTFIIINIMICVLSSNLFGRSSDKYIISEIQYLSEYKKLIKHYSSVIDSSKWIWKYQRKSKIESNFDWQNAKCNIDSLTKSIKNELYCFSPDRQEFIDIYGGCDISVLGNIARWDCDADNAALLYNKKDSSRQVLIGFGTQPVFLTSAWISNNVCAIFGLTWLFPDTLSNTDNPPGQFEMYLCNIKDTCIEMYTGPIITMKQNKWYRSTLFRHFKERHPEIK